MLKVEQDRAMAAGGPRPLARLGAFMRRALLLPALAIAAATAGPVAAQQPAASIPVAPTPARPHPAVAKTPAIPQPTHALEAADLESWLDGMLPAALKQGDVAGAVVSVVKDGHVLLAKGYGYADMATKRPMDANTTLVRPGSTSKLFTWTAVMQLVQAGKLDLNADVNRYLDFKLPEPYGRPITLNDLMTHRGGFEEGLKDAIVSDPGHLQPLDVFLKTHVRPVLFSPGEVPAYSNYGTAVAGYIVQRVSGERFDDYVARHIFAPLGMAHSTFTQPLPAAFVPGMSKGYMTATGGPMPFELISFAPAGSLSSTATDMANFMIAHLQDGRFGSAQILDPATARFMHAASLPHAPGFDVLAHGFFLIQRNGHTLLEHGGDTIVFHSDLEIMPQDNVGLFVSFNSRGQGDAVYGIRERLLQGFLDRYFPAPPSPLPPQLPTARADAPRIAGRYETSRRIEHGFMSLFYVLQGQEIVSANPDGTISLSSDAGKTFREVAPGLWQEAGGDRQLKLTRLVGEPAILDSHNPVGVLQPAPLVRNAALNLAIFALSFLVLVGAVTGWLIAEGARRTYRQPPALAGRARVARRLARIACAADLVYLVAWFAILKPILGNQVSFYTSSLDPVIRAMQIAGIVPVLGAVAGLWYLVLSWRAPRSWILKLGSLLGALALLGVLWIAYVGGLMSFTLNY